MVALFGALFYYKKNQQNTNEIKESNKSPLSWKQTPEEISELCNQAKQLLLTQLESIANTPANGQNFDSTIKEFESVTSNFVFVTDPLTFHKYVSPDQKLRNAADECEKSVSKIFVDIFTRKDLYDVFSNIKELKPKLDKIDQKLLDETIDGYLRNGLALDDNKRKEFIKMNKRLVDLTAQFRTRLNEWKDPTKLTRAELEGMPEDFIKGLKKDGDHFILTLKYPHIYPFLQDAKDANARKKLMTKFLKRGGTKNRDLLQEAVQIRFDLAKLLGYPTHAAFKLSKKMAKNPETVQAFLTSVRAKLQQKGKQDIAELLKLKSKDIGKKASSLKPWERSYYANQLKKTKYQVDNQKIKEYFPLEKVLSGMFEIYQNMLGVKFVEIVDAPKWHNTVKAYAVMDQGSDDIRSYFYMDLFPRDGKYGHAAAFTLISGRTMKDGSYKKPVSAIVANFNAPVGDNPSLLLHSQVETLFHEFGHIMHQILTTASYASFSGTSVKRDFVEAPSQMLENWVWKKEGLAKISAHYKDGNPLPDDLVNKLLAAKNANIGIRYLRQLFYASFDMALYTRTTRERFDTSKLYRKLEKEITMIAGLEGTFPEASFGHVMSGYDAGYYGYLWSEVYAADMFTRFEKEGLFNPETGRAYRKWILEPGGTEDPFELITKFLGRMPNQTAFFESIGVAN